MNTSRKFQVTRYGAGRFTPTWSDKLTVKSIEENRLTINADDEVRQSPLGKELLEQRAHTESNGIYTTFDVSLLFEALTGLELVNGTHSRENARRTTFTIRKAPAGLFITERNDSLRRIRLRASQSSEQLSIGSEGEKISLTHQHLFVPYSQSHRFQHSLRKRIFSQLSPLSSVICSELSEQVEVDIAYFSELSKQFDEALQQPVLPMPRLNDEAGEEIQTDYGVTIHCSQTFEVDESLLYYAPKFFSVLRQDLFLERIFIDYLLKKLDSLVNDEKNCIGLLLDIQLYVELPVIDEMLAKTQPLDIDMLRQALLGIAETLKEPYRDLSSLRAHLIEHHSLVLFTHVKRALTQEHMAWLADFDRYNHGSSFSIEYRKIMESEASTVQDLENLLARLKYPGNMIGFHDIVQPLYDLVNILKQPMTFEIERAESEQKNVLEQHERLCVWLEEVKNLSLKICKANWLTQLYQQVFHSPDAKSSFDSLLKNNKLDDALRRYCQAASHYDGSAVLLNAYIEYEHIVIASLFKGMTGITLDSEIASLLKEILFPDVLGNDLRKQAEYLLSAKENKNLEILCRPRHSCIIYTQRKFLLLDSSADKIKKFTLLFEQSESQQMLTLAFRSNQSIQKTHTLVRGQNKIEHCARINEDANTWVDALREPREQTSGFFKKERSLSCSGSPSKLTTSL